jgi:putative endonuclease
MRGGYVYMMSNKPHGVLYTGVTADLPARVWQHKNGIGSKFCRKYNCDKLVFAEPHATIDEAIAREKAIKAWPRLWKLELIHAANPNWDDLFERINW